MLIQKLDLMERQIFRKTLGPKSIYEETLHIPNRNYTFKNYLIDTIVNVTVNQSINTQLKHYNNMIEF